MMEEQNNQTIEEEEEIKMEINRLPIILILFYLIDFIGAFYFLIALTSLIII